MLLTHPDHGWHLFRTPILVAPHATVLLGLKPRWIIERVGLLMDILDMGFQVTTMIKHFVTMWTELEITFT